MMSSQWYRGVHEGVIENFPLGQWIVSGLSSLTQFKFSCRTVDCIVVDGVIESFHGGTTVGTGAPHEGGPGDTTGGAIGAATCRTC